MLDKTGKELCCMALALILPMAVSACAGSSSADEPADDRGLAKAYFAGGCFWCMEEAFEEVEGVTEVVSGYMGGQKPEPTYEEVSAGGTGHAESVEVRYDPNKVRYETLLAVFWRNIDPTTPNRQFCDRGNQYRSAIFYRGAEEHRLAQASRQRIEQTRTFPEPIVTEIVAASTFYPAEGYHQDFYEKNPIRYRLYKFNCGRSQRLAELWGSAEKS